jgi:hypothetical protein
LTENDFSWCDYGLLADFGLAAGQRARNIRRVTFLPQPMRTRGQPSLFPHQDEMKFSLPDQWSVRLFVALCRRYGLRASELVDLQWNLIGFDAGNLGVRRAEKGTPSPHLIRAMNCGLCAGYSASRTLNRHLCSLPSAVRHTTAGFGRMVERAGEAAAFGFKAHPHMLLSWH